VNDKSILRRLSEDGQDAPRVRLDEGAPSESESSERYQIVGEIARGGVGVIYKGRDSDLGRDVAMKLLRDDYLEHPELIQRFVEEAQVGGQLQHPGIVPVYELGIKDGNRPYFAMKLVKGRTLAELLAERRDPSEGRRALLAQFAQVCQTVAYAHSRGVIHRDLKPANIMVGGFGEVQVVDWGFAKVLQRGGIADERRAKRDVTVVATVRSAVDGSASVAGSVMGTPAYMPPEQALGQVDDLTERADVFSLGAILCEILTGQPPYTEDVFAAAAQARLEDAHARLDSCGAAPELIALGKTCLSGLPKERPHSAREVANVVSAHLAEAEARAHNAKLRAAEAEAKSEELRRARKHTIGVAAAILTVVLLGGAAWFTIQRTGDQRERERIGAYEAAMLEATRLDAEAEWPGARSAAEQALGLSTDDPARGVEAQSVYDRIDAHEKAADLAAQKAESESALLAKLEEIGLLRSDDFKWRRHDDAYAAALPDFTALGTFDRKAELARVFDNWAWLRRVWLKERDWRELDRIARMLDPDPWRNRLREAAANGDAALLLALAAEPETAARGARSLTLLAYALWESRQREAAVELLRAAYEKEPGDFWINFHLATFAAGWSAERGRYEGSLDEGIAHFLAALALRPTSAGTHNNLGNALYQKGDLDGAIAQHREAIRFNPNLAMAHSNLGAMLYEAGDPDGAVAACREAIRLEPDDAAAHTNLGIALGALGDWDGSVTEHREAIRLDPTDAELHTNLGAALHMKGDFDGAIAAYRESVRLNPADTVAQYNLVFAQTKKAMEERIASARPRLAAILRGEQQPKSAEDCLGLASLCAQNKNDAAAARFYRQAFQEKPELGADPRTALRYSAVCAAARVGTEEWCAQAVAWLRADLEVWKSSGAANARLATLSLSHWKRDGDLASIRDADDLPDAFKQLWIDIDALLAQLR